MRPIILVDTEANMHKKHLGIIAMIQVGNIYGISPEKYVSLKEKATEIQALNTRMFYDLIRKKRIPAMIIFTDMVSKYDLMVHIIASISFQRVDIPKEPILCTFTMLQRMSH